MNKEGLGQKTVHWTVLKGPVTQCFYDASVGVIGFMCRSIRVCRFSWMHVLSKGKNDIKINKDLNPIIKWSLNFSDFVSINILHQLESMHAANLWRTMSITQTYVSGLAEVCIAVKISPQSDTSLGIVWWLVALTINCNSNFPPWFQSNNFLSPSHLWMM